MKRVLALIFWLLGGILIAGLLGFAPVDDADRPS
jgi:hypothetical protein